MILRDPPWIRNGPPDPEPQHCDGLQHDEGCDQGTDCDCRPCTGDDKCPCPCEECDEVRAYMAACEPDPREGCEDDS